MRQGPIGFNDDVCILSEESHAEYIPMYQGWWYLSSTLYSYKLPVQLTGPWRMTRLAHGFDGDKFRLFIKFIRFWLRHVIELVMRIRMEGSKMSITEYYTKAIMYSAYDTPMNCAIYVEIKLSGNPVFLLPNNAGRPTRQFKCPLAWFKWRAGSPPVRFLFSREGCIDPDAGISPCANRMGKQVFQEHFDETIYQWEHIC